jgi:hypothetical protein
LEVKEDQVKVEEGDHEVIDLYHLQNGLEVVEEDAQNALNYP